MDFYNDYAIQAKLGEIISKPTPILFDRMCVLCPHVIFEEHECIYCMVDVFGLFTGILTV